MTLEKTDRKQKMVPLYRIWDELHKEYRTADETHRDCLRVTPNGNIVDFRGFEYKNLQEGPYANFCKVERCYGGMDFVDKYIYQGDVLKIEEDEARECENFRYDYGIVNYKNGVFYFDLIGDVDDDPYEYGCFCDSDWLILGNHESHKLQILGNINENQDLVEKIKKDLKMFDSFPKK